MHPGDKVVQKVRINCALPYGIEQMYGTVTEHVDIFDVHIESAAVAGFGLDVESIQA